MLEASLIAAVALPGALPQGTDAAASTGTAGDTFGSLLANAVPAGGDAEAAVPQSLLEELPASQLPPPGTEGLIAGADAAAWELLAQDIEALRARLPGLRSKPDPDTLPPAVVDDDGAERGEESRFEPIALDPALVSALGLPISPRVDTDAAIPRAAAEADPALPAAAVGTASAPGAIDGSTAPRRPAATAKTRADAAAASIQDPAAAAPSATAAADAPLSEPDPAADRSPTTAAPERPRPAAAAVPEAPSSPAAGVAARPDRPANAPLESLRADTRSELVTLDAANPAPAHESTPMAHSASAPAPWRIEARSPVDATPPPFAAQLSAAIDSQAFAPALGVQVAMLARNGIAEASLQVNPAQWGPIAVQIELDGRHAQVTLVAEHAVTRQALEQAMPQLAAVMSEAGFSFTGGGVFQQPRDSRGQPPASALPASAQAGDVPAAAVAATPGARIQQGLLDLYA